VKALLVAGGLAAASAGLLLAGPMRTEARDYGQASHAFPVIEPDLLSTIEGRLRRAEASGELARTNEMFAKRVEARVRRPDPVAGITMAIRPRTWDFDPSVTMERDIRDQKGNLIAAAGQKINPLDFVAIRQDLVFVDGDDIGQLNWATKRYSDLGAKIIFVKGSPIERMTEQKRRFFFDQAGKLTGRFGIEHVPAVVTQVGKLMRVSEIVLPSGKRA
jgi:conjugal transfer pilus assembly protein TraW